MSTAAGAALLRVSRQYFHRTATAKSIPYVRIGRTIAWDERTVRAWANERKQKQEVK